MLVALNFRQSITIFYAPVFAASTISQLTCIVHMPFSHLTANRFPFSQRQHTQYRFVRTADTVENYRTNVDVEPLSFKVEM